MFYLQNTPTNKNKTFHTHTQEEEEERSCEELCVDFKKFRTM